MNIDSLGKAFRAIGVLESWIESAVDAEIEGAADALANLKVVEDEIRAAKDLYFKAQGLLND